MKFNVVASTLVAASLAMSANVSIQVMADSGRIPISPAIYGRNGSGVSNNPSDTTTDAALFLARESGLRIARETGGNNQTKYNWRKKISSHPDWYNNVYAQDWDFSASEIQKRLPGFQGMYGFQLLGWVASTDAANFDANAYNNSAYWPGVGQNLAGGGVLNPAGNAPPLKQGDATKYCQPWPADSSAAILGHWFGPGGVGLDSTRFRYWGMDNEVEIWNATHDDVDSLVTGHILTAEECVQRWAAVAKAARKYFPGIKLAGPASASPWQWYTWPGGSLIPYKGANYCWPEYLIKRLAEIQDSTKVRMLDVYDVHFYLPGNTKEVIQQHFRLLWDTTYYGPNNDANRFADGGYNQGPQHEMFFKRVNDWCDKYFGKGNGITVGATESGMDAAVSAYPSETATWYASLLGTFADHGAELFTPWMWYPGMWETLHLFARYAQADRVKSTSSYDTLVSAYSSISKKNDSMTVILVNRGPSTQTASVSLSGFSPASTGTSLRLAGLTGETFVSHTQNALQMGTVSVSGGNFTTDLPAYSVTAYQFTKATTGIVLRSGSVRMRQSAGTLDLSGGPSAGSVELHASSGAVVAQSSWADGAARFELSGLPRGVYFVDWVGGRKKVMVSSR